MEPMRKVLLWASTNRRLSQRLPERRFVRRAVRKFMPGETLEDALGEAARLREEGIPTLVTTLGENVETAEETRASVAEYVRAVDLADGPEEFSPPRGYGEDTRAILAEAGYSGSEIDRMIERGIAAGR